MPDEIVEDNFPDDEHLSNVRRWFANYLLNGRRVKCPVCTKVRKIQPRTLNERIERVMCAMREKGGPSGTDWVYMPRLQEQSNRDLPPSSSGEFAFAAHWGLIERKSGKGSRGWWRLTPKGIRFLDGEIRVPKTLYIYDNRVEAEGTETVNVVDVRNTPFDDTEFRPDN